MALPRVLSLPGNMVGNAPSPLSRPLSLVVSSKGPLPYVTPRPLRRQCSEMISPSSLLQDTPTKPNVTSPSLVRLKPLEKDKLIAPSRHRKDKRNKHAVFKGAKCAIRFQRKKRLASVSLPETSPCQNDVECENESSTDMPESNTTNDAEEEEDGGSDSPVYEAEKELSNLSLTQSQVIKPKPLLQKRMSVLSAIKPENQDAERQRFFCCNFHYNPTFLYSKPVTAPMLEKFGCASDRLLHLAVKIMENALRRHGSYEEFERKTGGRQLSRTQIREAAVSYLTAEGLQDEVEVELVDDLVSRACMTRIKGKPTLRVRTSNMREHWMIGLLRHELGTHYLRSCNNRYQVWHRARLRSDLELEPANPTEEGLASLHSVIFREDPCLWRCALLYYTIYKASQLSFSDLFEDLGRFLLDPNVRWDYCLRAKRGQGETSGPGAFCKDQVYLEGALQLLKHRRTTDFHKLVQLGKISYLDLERLRFLGNYKNTRIPSFMEDLSHYLNSLQDILYKNGLSDDDLVDV